MGQTIKIKRGNRSFIPSNLQDGELFLVKDDGKLIIKNNEILVELANDSDLKNLFSQLNSLVETVNTISGNVADLNIEIDTKLTSPSGQKGQLLGYVDNNVIQAVDAPELGINAITSIEPPENSKINDLWFQILN